MCISSHEESEQNSELCKMGPGGEFGIQTFALPEQNPKADSITKNENAELSIIRYSFIG